MHAEAEPLIGNVHAVDRLGYPTRWTKSVSIARMRALASATALLLFLFYFRIILAFTNLPDGSSTKIKLITPVIELSENILHSWALYSPYYPAGDYPPPPRNCKITQVNVIQRHGARFPSPTTSVKIEEAVAKLQGISAFKDSRLNFLKNYSYDLGFDDLVPFGAAQSFDSGQLDFARYKHLTNKHALPFVRSTSFPRVVHSAMSWTAGFATASGNIIRPKLNVILQDTLNDTLEAHMCPNVGTGEAQMDTWQSIYAAPIRTRLNTAAPGANLTLEDVSSLISLCPFDTLAKEKPSPFCSLFSQSDFIGFAYLTDLKKFYGKGGYGQALGRVQGVGYVNELLARLTENPVRDNTQTNRTLDASPDTFPLDRTLYVDFSRDNPMAAVYGAIGLFRQRSPLNPTKPDPARTWIASKLFPFSARLVTERLQCGTKTYVRMLVDDALQDLSFCGADEDGLCELNAFVESQDYARSDGAGDFEKCFEDL